MAEAYAAADEVEFRLNGVAVAAVPVGTVIRGTGEAGQVTVTTRADWISDTVVQIDVAQSPGRRCSSRGFHTPTRPYAHDHARPLLALVNPRVKPRCAQTRQELPS